MLLQLRVSDNGRTSEPAELRAGTFWTELSDRAGRGSGGQRLVQVCSQPPEQGNILSFNLCISCFLQIIKKENLLDL